MIHPIRLQSCRLGWNIEILESTDCLPALVSQRVLSQGFQIDIQEQKAMCGAVWTSDSADLPATEGRSCRETCERKRKKESKKEVHVGNPSHIGKPHGQNQSAKILPPCRLRAASVRPTVQLVFVRDGPAAIAGIIEETWARKALSYKKVAGG